MKRFLLFATLLFSPQIVSAQCYQNGIPCGQAAPGTGSALPGTSTSGTTVIMGVDSTDRTKTVPVMANHDGEVMVDVMQFPALPAGSNGIGSINNTTFGASQSGQWNVNTVSSITNPVAVTQSGEWSLGLSGTLPGFTSTPTFNLGTLNGAATESSVQSVNTTLGSPFQVGGLIGNSAFGASQVGPWSVGLAAGSNAIGSITNSAFGATQSGAWNVGVTGPVSVTGDFYQSVQPVSQSGPWSMSIDGKLPGFMTTPTVNLGTLGGAATEAGVQAVKSTLGTPFQANGLIGNSAFGSVQSGSWSVSLLGGTSAIGSITNSAFGITGTLPAFANTPTFNIGTAPVLTTTDQGRVDATAPTLTDGATHALSLTTAGALRTDSSATTQPVSGTVTANIGSVGGLALDSSLNGLFKAGQSIGNTVFGSNQVGNWNIGINAGTNTIGSVANTSFGISGTLPAFASTPTVNLGTVGGLALDTSIAALRTSLGSPLQAGGSIGNTAFGISGTLPAFAATPTFNLGSSPVIVTNSQGIVVATPTTITSGSTRALSLTTLGYLRTDSSATTQPTSVANGSDVATGNTADAAYTGSGTSSVVSALKGVYANQTATNTNLNTLITNTTGVATASNQATQITAIQAVQAQIGAVSNPAAGSVNAQLATIIANQTNGTERVTVITTSSTPTQQGGVIATSGGTATVSFVATSDTEIVNPSTSTLWGSWGTPSVNGANSYPISPGGSYRPPNRPVGTFTLLSTTASQPYTATRF